MTLGSRKPNTPTPFILEGYWLSLVYITVLSYVVDAPFRYLASLIHLEPIVYLRDVFIMAVVVRSISHWISGGRPSPQILVFGVLLMHAFWGMLYLPTVIQPIAGLKVYLSFLLGAACYESISLDINRFLKWVHIYFYVTAIGVGINWLTDMPWTGSTFSSAIGEVTVSREWTMVGIRRIAGFARASYEASTILCIAGAPILASPTLKARWKILIYLITTALIIATTSKGSVIAWVAMGVCVPFTSKLLSREKISYIVLASPILCVGLPIFFYLYDFRADLRGPLGWLLSSFAERINQMWPEAFDLVKLHGNPVLGRGLGSIGFAQQFGDYRYYNTADNVMVYLYISFGALSFAYVYATIISITKNSAKISQMLWPSVMLWLIHWFAYGLTGNNIEAPFTQFFSGIIVGAAIYLHSERAA